MKSQHPPQFFLSLYGWTYWVPVLMAGTAGVVVGAVVPGWWPVSAVFGVLTLACLAFYRDFNRPIPQEPDVMVAPADGKVTEIATVAEYAPLGGAGAGAGGGGGAALKISIFLSVLDVHVNRVPCDGVVLWTRYEEGLFLDARHPDCSARDQSNTICMGAVNAEGEMRNAEMATQPAKPIAVVKQIAGAIARRIIAPVAPGERLVRGQRFGMIAFGSRTELYVPVADGWRAAVTVGTHVKGGKDVLLRK